MNDRILKARIERAIQEQDVDFLADCAWHLLDLVRNDGGSTDIISAYRPWERLSEWVERTRS